MRRRDVLAWFSGTIAFCGHTAAQAALPVVGVLHSGDERGLRQRMVAFRSGLGDVGFEEGRSVAFEYRWASDAYGRLPELASDLVKQPVSVLACFGPAAALAAKAATSTLPIIFVALADPVRLGLVGSLGQPGGNATGTASLIIELDAKRLELIHELVAPGRPIGLLVNPNRPGVDNQIAEVRSMADRLGRSLVVDGAGTPDAIDTAFARFADQRAAALVIAGDPFFAGQAEKVVALARARAIPTMYQWREFVEVGGLMSYGPSRAEAYRQSGAYAGRVLRGERTVDLPVLQPAKLELVLSLGVAKSLDLAIPASLLARADEVID